MLWIKTDDSDYIISLKTIPLDALAMKTEVELAKTIGTI